MDIKLQLESFLKGTNYAAQKKYKKDKVKRYYFEAVSTTEQDIIQKLDSVKNKAGYIKNLIREDIKNDVAQHLK